MRDEIPYELYIPFMQADFVDGMTVYLRANGDPTGTFNTMRQLGAVVGSAVIGAVLQAQLAIDLPAEASSAASGLPAQFRDQCALPGVGGDTGEYREQQDGVVAFIRVRQSRRGVDDGEAHLRPLLSGAGNQCG